MHFRNASKTIEQPSNVTGVVLTVVILAIPPSKLRKWMLVAYDEQMVAGDYVFIFIDVETPSSDVRDDWLSKKMWRDGDGRNDNALTAFSNVLVVSLGHNVKNKFIDAKFHVSTVCC